MKKTIKTKDAKKGGYLVGKPHSEGGIKAIVTDTNQPIEVEGGEVIITKPAVESARKYNFEGKEMTPKEIMSKLNSDHGGVSFKKGGEIKKKKYNTGGEISNELKDKINNSYLNANGVYVSNDDISNVLNIVEKVDISKDIKITTNFTDILDIQQYMTIGSYVYVKNYNSEPSDRNLFGNEYYERIKQNGYDKWIPWRVKNMVFNGTQLVKLTLHRHEEDGEYEFDFNLDYRGNDRLLVCNTPIINLNEDYPQEPNPYLLYPDNFATLCIRFYIRENKIDSSNYFACEEYANIYLGTEQTTGINYRVVTRNVSSGSYNNRNVFTLADNLQDFYFALFVGSKCDLSMYREDFVIFEVEDYEISAKTYYDYKIKQNINANDILPELVNGRFNKLENCLIKGYKVIDNLIKDIIFEYNGTIYAIDFLQSRKNINAMLFSNMENFVDFENRWGGSKMTDTEKLIRKYRKKEISDKELYGELINALDIEILQYQTIRDFTNPNQKTKINQIDRKLEELREQRDKYALEYDTNVELIDKLGKTLEISRIEKEEPPTTRLSINGQPSELTDSQYDKVRTEKFKAWFGDWINAYEFDNYAGVSKVINARTKEPIVCYHGSRADFMSWRFNDFPAAYFADNRSYSQWFANLSSDGFMYQVFIDIKNPIDVMFMGLKEFTIREIMEHLRDTYDLPLEQILPRYKQYEAGGQDALEQYLNAPMKFWQFIRHHNPNLINYLRDNTFYDGIMMYEDNLQDIVNGQPNTTGSYMVFRQSQIKWATAEHFNTQVNNAGFAKGGMLPPDYTNLTLDDI